jgi:cell shape-determining protein MreC
MEVIISEKKEYTRPRNVNLAFRVTEEERGLIERQMKQAGIKNMRAYIVQQAIDGRVIHVEPDSAREMVRLLSNATNNINQIARRANETGSIYARDVRTLQKHYEELWPQMKEVLRRLSSIK